MRMGSPKALLPDDEGRPFVVRIIRSLNAAGLDDIVIVTGRHHEAITAAVDQSDLPTSPLFARNPDPSRGQLSSLWIGMDAIEQRRPEAMLVTLVDVPMIAPSTIRVVLDTWRRTRAPVVRPIVGGRRGHPVIFDASLFDELRSAPLDRGARVVVHAQMSSAVDVPVDDADCLIDVDTPADYQRLRDR